MEPFGLFHLLQSLLGGNEAQQTQSQTAASPSDELSAPPVTQAAPTSDLPRQSVAQEAALDFMRAHEARARRIKK